MNSSNLFAFFSRKSSVTAEVLETYKDLVKTATDDLEAHLGSINEKLEAIFSRTMTESASDAVELRLMKEERTSAQKCLEICAQLSDHINEIQLTPNRGGSSPGSKNPDTLPERLTSEGLQECKRSLSATIEKLESYMKDRIDRLVIKSKIAMASEEDLAELVRLQEEWEATRQSRDIYSKFELHLKENITTIENYATGDAIQFMVSTNGSAIHGTNRGLGWRTRQVGGHLSDLSVQQLSRDMSSTCFKQNEDEDPVSRSNTALPDDGRESKPSSHYQERYGQGFKLPKG